MFSWPLIVYEKTHKNHKEIKLINATYSFMVLPMMPEEEAAFLISSAAAEIAPIILKHNI